MKLRTKENIIEVQDAKGGKEVMIDGKSLGIGQVLYCSPGAVSVDTLDIKGTNPLVGNVLVFFGKGEKDPSYVSPPITEIEN